MKDKKPTNLHKRFDAKKITLVIVASLILVGIGRWLFVAFEPHPLGDKLEYLGKSDYGCILVCDAKPGSTYYYGTDMTPEEVVGYFKGAHTLYPTQIQSEYTAIWLKNNSYEDTINVYYYSNETAPFKNHQKKYTIAIDIKDYKAARASL